jgi:hypothetical protein
LPLYILILAFCFFLFLLLKKIGNKELILIAGIFFVGYLLSNFRLFPFSWFPGALLLALPPESEVIRYEEDVPEEGKAMLKDCFGEDSVLLEGVRKEQHYFDECDRVNVTIHYMEWTLSYKNGDGQDCAFVFDNRDGEFNKESIEDDMERYFSHMTEEFYRMNFWDKRVAGISGLREDESTLYFQKYPSVVSRDVPEFQTMFDQMQRYSLAESMDFTHLQYREVFKKFPYSLHLVLYVDYESDKGQKRAEQRQETERKVRQITEELISYTGHSLNAVVNVTMMDEKGCADAFNIAVVEGEYFRDTEDGKGYNIALYESFFGSLD